MTPNKEKKECECMCHLTSGRDWCDLCCPVNALDPKEKKECAVSHLYGKDNNKELHFYCENCDKEMGFDEKRVCSAYAPDPLTSLLQSATKEFEETKFAKGGGSSFECSDYEGMYVDLKSFLTSKLTEAFNKGKEMR